MEGLDLNDVIVSLYDLLQRTIRQNIDIETSLTPFGAKTAAMGPVGADSRQSGS